MADADGNVYVDMTAGFGAALIGHTHPHVVAALRTQSERMLHALGDVYPSDVKVALEARLAQMAPWPARVILGLSGADAIEAALKTAVLHTKRSGVLAFEGGYHGLSYGAVSVCGYKRAFREPFARQLNANVCFAPYADSRVEGALERSLGAVDRAFARGDVGAVLVEPVQGRGGVVVPPEGFLSALSERAKRVGAVLIVDEIYTGLHRTGGVWRAVDDGCDPDIVCLGKALGGGLPVSACVMRDEVANAWGDPDGEAIHTSTFLGNPLACAAAMASLDVLESPETQVAIRVTGARLADALDILAVDPALGITRVTHVGLLAGVTVAGGVARSLAVMRAMLERGYVLLPGGVAGDVLTLTPPCTLTAAQVAGFAQALDASLRAVRP